MLTSDKVTTIQGNLFMDLGNFISLISYGLLAVFVVFVLHNHWQEFHGDNHF